MRKSKRRRERAKRIRALLLAALLVLAGAVTYCLTRFVGEDAVVIQDGGTMESGLRIQLRSLGTPKELTLTIDGVYTVENDPGFRLARGMQASVWEDKGEVWLSCGDITLNMGARFTLTRHKADAHEPNGFYIEQAAQQNIYNGDVELSASDGGVSALLFVDLEEYLYGVVPYEMSDNWPLEALKAQAVAARTYALGRKAMRTAQAYDLVDTTADQVFKGFNADMINAIEAVDATRGIVGMYKGSFATCYYSASNGGQTELPQVIWGRDGDYGYLDRRDDPYDLENPYSSVRSLDVPADGSLMDERLTALLKSALSEQLAAMGFSEDAVDIRITRVFSIAPGSGKGGADSRMYEKLTFAVQVEGRRWTTQATAGEPTSDQPGATFAETPPSGLTLGAFETIDRTLYVDLSTYGQLKPTFPELSINGGDYEMFTVVAVAANGTETQLASLPDHTDTGTLSEPVSATGSQDIVSFRIETRRFGHGVGMSQRGAQMMAGQHGAKYTDVLMFYYPGMELVRYTLPNTPLVALEDLPEGVGAERIRKAAATPAPLPALREGERYAVVTLSSDTSTLNVRSEPNTSSAVLSSLNNGQKVILVELFADWSYIRTAEIEGYVSGEYLRDAE